MLELSNVINISVAQAPTGLGAYNVNNIALFTGDTPPVEYGNYGVYVSPAAVAADFGTSSETYKQAAAIFAQQPNILAGGGNLIVFPFVAITAGQIRAFDIYSAGAGYSVGDVLTVTGGGGSSGTLTVTDVDASGAVLAVELTTAGSGYSVGTDYATSVAPPGGTGATISLTEVSGAVETLAEAIVRTKDLIFYCGILSTSYPIPASMKGLADVVQGLGDKILFLGTNSQAVITAGFTDIKNASDYNTRCLFYSTNALDARLFAAAYASRGMAVNFAGSNTAITMNLKSLSTISPDEGVTQTIYTALETAGVDGYVDYAGVPSIVSNGANKYFDEIYNLIWFVSALKVAGFNALRELTTKIPQTEPGMSVLKDAYRRVCEQAVNNGFIAPGSWTSSEWFGSQVDMLNNISERGYYIYSQPVYLQAQADREDRKAPLVQIAIKEAGAIHSSTVIVNVNP